MKSWILFIIWKIRNWTVMWAIMIISRKFMRWRKHSWKRLTVVSSRKSASWRISLQEIKLVCLQEIWRCPVRKSWIRWMWSSLRKKDQSRNSISNMEELLVRCFLRRRILWQDMMNHCLNRWISLWNVDRKSHLLEQMELEKLHC